MMKKNLLIYGSISIFISLIFFLFLIPNTLNVFYEDIEYCQNCTKINSNLSVGPFQTEFAEIEIEENLGGITLRNHVTFPYGNRIDIYLVDSIVFEELRDHLDSNILKSNALKLKNRGVFLVEENVSYSSYYSFEKVIDNLIINANNHSLYAKNDLISFRKGTYYLIYKNNFDSNVSVSYTFLLLPSKSITSLMREPVTILFTVMGFPVFLFAGIILILKSIIYDPNKIN